MAPWKSQRRWHSKVPSVLVPQNFPLSFNRQLIVYNIYFFLLKKKNTQHQTPGLQQAQNLTHTHIRPNLSEARTRQPTSRKLQDVPFLQRNIRMQLYGSNMRHPQILLSLRVRQPMILNIGRQRGLGL